MDKTQFISLLINIALAILALLISFVSYYFYIKSKIYKEVSGAVRDAESPGKTGPEKLGLATAQAYALVPPVLKPFISRELVKQLVQATFNKIEAYAVKQASKNAPK